jgi:hypothetical protein
LEVLTSLKTARVKHPSIAVTLQVAASSTVRELVMSSRFDVGLAADEIDVAGLEHQLPKDELRHSVSAYGACDTRAYHGGKGSPTSHSHHSDSQKCQALGREPGGSSNKK